MWRTSTGSEHVNTHIFPSFAADGLLHLNSFRVSIMISHFVEKTSGL